MQVPGNRNLRFSLSRLLIALPTYLKGMKQLYAALAALLFADPAIAQEAALDLNPQWEYVADTVMGGVSSGQIESLEIDGNQATRLTGQVSLDNNGGFVQMAFDFMPDATTFNASAYAGIQITLRGNNEAYDLRLRTDELTRPWHSFRTEVTATNDWQTLRVPFDAFVPHRTDVTLDTARLRRFGVLAIGRVFEADVAVSEIGFY